MANVTTEEFRRFIKTSSHKPLFDSKVAEYTNEGKERPEAWQAAKTFVLDKMRESGETDDTGEEYLKRNFGPSKDLRADFMWVNDNREGEADWGSCPSNGSRNIFHQYKTNKQFRTSFEDKLAKVLPSGTELKELKRKQDDGRKLTELNKKISIAKMKSMGEYVDELDLGDDD